MGEAVMSQMSDDSTPLREQHKHKKKKKPNQPTGLCFILHCVSSHCSSCHLGLVWTTFQQQDAANIQTRPNIPRGFPGSVDRSGSFTVAAAVVERDAAYVTCKSLATPRVSWCKTGQMVAVGDAAGFLLQKWLEGINEQGCVNDRKPGIWDHEEVGHSASEQSISGQVFSLDLLFFFHLETEVEDKHGLKLKLLQLFGLRCQFIGH